MMFLITCSKCSHKMNVPERLKGKKARCKSCQALVLLEPSSSVAESEDDEPELELEIPEEADLLAADSLAADPASEADGPGGAPAEALVAKLASPDDRIEVRCEECGNVIRVPPSFAGKQGQCSKCGQSLTIPGGAVPLMAEAPAAPSEELDPLDAALDRLGDDDSLDLMITVPCPKCAQIIRVPESLAGRMGRCKACDTTVKIPGGEEPEPVDPSELAPAPSPTARPGSSLRQDGPLAEVITNPEVGFGGLFVYATKVANRNLVDLLAFAFVANASAYGLYFLAAKLASKVVSGPGTRYGEAYISGFDWALIGSIIAAYWSVVLVLKTGMISLAHSALMSRSKPHWMDGFGELTQAIKAFLLIAMIALISVGVGYLIVPEKGNPNPGLVMLAVGAAYLVYSWVGIFVPNEMVFQSEQGPLETLFALARSTGLGRWGQNIALLIARSGFYGLALLLHGIAFAALDMGQFKRLGGGGIPWQIHVFNVVMILVFSFIESRFDVLYSAVYLRFRMARRL